jgi:hypothetical protein
VVGSGFRNEARVARVALDLGDRQLGVSSAMLIVLCSRSSRSASPRTSLTAVAQRGGNSSLDTEAVAVQRDGIP